MLEIMSHQVVSGEGNFRIVCPTKPFSRPRLFAAFIISNDFEIILCFHPWIVSFFVFAVA